MTFSFLMSWREGVLREQIRFSADNLEKNSHEFHDALSQPKIRSRADCYQTFQLKLKESVWKVNKVPKTSGITGYLETKREPPVISLYQN